MFSVNLRTLSLHVVPLPDLQVFWLPPHSGRPTAQVEPVELSAA